MKLKDIADMENYLENRCYCPHEIYDCTNIFYNLFYPDQDCVFIGSYKKDDDTFVYVVADNEYGISQIIGIIINCGSIEDCVRFDATEHNIDQVKKRATGEVEFITYDYYSNNTPVKRIKDIMSIADMIIVS